MLATWKPLLAALVAVALVPACGDDSDGLPSGRDLSELAGDAAEDGEEFTEALNDALGAGGGGTLFFDGEEIPIASATCALRDDTFDIGTISDNQFRVFVTKNRPESEVSVQILDADFLQWFPQNVSGDEAVRNGNVFTSGPLPYFNNSDDRIVEARFTIECP